MIRVSRVLAYLAFVAIISGGILGLSLRSATGAGTTRVVNSTAGDDDGVCNALPAGDCTLPDAVGLSIAGDAIHFDIPGTDAGCDGSGVCTIQPSATMVVHGEGLVIDGYTQAGASPNTSAVGSDAVLKIVIDMSGAGSGGAMTLADTNVTVKGLVFNGVAAFSAAITVGAVGTGSHIVGNFVGTDETGTIDASEGSGVSIKGVGGVHVGGTAAADRNIISGNATGVSITGQIGLDAIGNIIENNYIGTDASGTLAVANGTGVSLSYTGEDLSNNIIGGTAPASRNVISGNTGDGVYIDNPTGTGNEILGNYIGTNAAGTAALPNNVGVHLAAGNGNSVDGNVISGNTDDGVSITNPDSTSVLANLIGTDATGTAGLGNGGVGITVLSALDTEVGNGTLSGRNVISSNLVGISVEGGINSAGTTIRGNLIGTDATGTVDLGNSSDGVYLALSVSDVSIHFNVISGNGSRGIITSSNGGNIAIQGNRIGTDLSGNNALGNGSHGILIRTADSTIGGPAALRNTVAFNGSAGVAVGDNVTGVEMRSNIIHSNAALGIDLGVDGVTANDVGDGDIGNNDKQNFPALTAAVSGSLRVEFTFDSAPSTDFRLQFFQNDACDSSGNGEGQALVGSVQITTDSNGDFSIPVLTSDTITPGKSITATATNLTTGDTSEFSNCVTVQGPSTPTPTPSPTPIGQTPTPTPSPSPIGQTPTPTPTATPTPITLETDPPTPTPSPTPVPTPTPTATATPGPSQTGQTPSPTPSPTSTGGTPTPTATPTPTPTPGGETPTPTASTTPEQKQGDVDCDNDVDSVDALKQLRYVAQLSVQQHEPCPDIGTEVASFFGDVDCSGSVTSVDALKVLRHVALLSVSQMEPCPDIGEGM